MKKLSLFYLPLILWSCSSSNEEMDSYGNFEAEDIIISAQVSGELLEFRINEGDQLIKEQVYGFIDTTDLFLIKQEMKANIEVISSQYQDLTGQVNVLEAEKKNVEREIERTKKLVDSEAATRRQLDDLQGKKLVIEQKIAAIRSKNPAVFSQLEVANVKLAQINEKISKSILKSPTKGIVLNKVANTHQLMAPGMPLFTMADLSTLTLRAYVSGNQLSEVTLGEEVEVVVDHFEEGLKTYKGKVSWIASEAEFTPKIIQTREERVDMVYAIKVIVENDGMLKIGMPGEVKFFHAEG